MNQKNIYLLIKGKLKKLMFKKEEQYLIFFLKIQQEQEQVLKLLLKG